MSYLYDRANECHRELGGEGLSFRNQGLILVQPGSVAGNYVVLLGS